MTPTEAKRDKARQAANENVLSALLKNNGCRAKDLTEATGFSMPKVVRALADLMAKGSVTRVVPISYLDPTTWHAQPNTELPMEYIKVQSIFRVGDRVKSMMEAKP